MSSNRHLTDLQEMTRRWDALSAAMDDDSIDCLFMWSTDRVFSAYLRYVTDFPTLLYPLSALFSKQGISIVAHGSKNGSPYPANIKNPGVIDLTSVPWTPTATYAPTLWPEKIAELVRQHGYRRIGIVGMGIVPALFIDHFRAHLGDVDLVDATLLVDNIKAVKSDYEIAAAQRCVDLIDGIMAAIPGRLQVGKGIRDIGLELRALADRSECQNVNILLGKHPTMPVMSMWEFTDNDVLEPGDSVCIMVELASPEGIWGECARVYALGEPHEELVRTVEAAFELRDELARQLVPGAAPRAVYERYTALVETKGFLPEKRFCAHGQGYDVMETPFIRPESDRPLRQNMFVAVHPTPMAPARKTGCFICDNYLVTTGGATLMSKTPSELIRVPIQSMTGIEVLRVGDDSDTACYQKYQGDSVCNAGGS